MKVNGTYVVDLLKKGNLFLIQQGKTFEVANFSADSKKTQDFGKESFVQDLSTHLEGIEFKRSRKEILTALLDSYTDETLDKLASALNESFSSNCYPVKKWFDIESHLSSDEKKKKVAAMLFLEEVPDFITVDEVTKDKKKDKEYKELFAPMITLSKAFPKTGDESLHSITKAAALKSDHEKFRKLAVVFSDFIKKGLYHCFRPFDIKELLKILENDDIHFDKITGDKRKNAIKFYSMYLSIMNKVFEEDETTGFWKLQQRLENKVTYFDVQIEDGNLLASPKIIETANMDVNQDIQVEETAEKKGKNDSIAESNESKESEPNGGFHDGFNPSRTKHEEAIDKKCSQDLIDLLRKNGVPEAETVKNLDFKAFIQFLSKKRAASLDQTEEKKEDSKPAAKKQKDATSNTSDPSSKPPPANNSSKQATSSSSSKSSSSAPSSSSKEGIGSATSKKAIGSSNSKSSSSTGTSDVPSTPVKTTKGKWFKKLNKSPSSSSSGKKFVVVNATIPFKNEFSDKFEVIFGITAINELNRGPDKHMFEWRAQVFVKSLQVAYSTWEEEEFQFQIGSMTSLTEKLLSAGQSVLRIRANPGSMNNDYLSFNTYTKYQTVLKMQLDVKTIEEANKEVPKLIQELQQILSSPDWFLCYQISCYWEFVSPENTTEVDDVLQELWEKAAGSKEDPNFAFIKNGLQKIFKDAMGRARGGLYGSLVVDQRNALRTDVGVNPIVSTLDLKFDEFLVDEDISVYVNQTYRQYSDEASLVLFKTQFDDRNMNNFF